MYLGTNMLIPELNLKGSENWKTIVNNVDELHEGALVHMINEYYDELDDIHEFDEKSGAVISEQFFDEWATQWNDVFTACALTLQIEKYSLIDLVAKGRRSYIKSNILKEMKMSGGLRVWSYEVWESTLMNCDVITKHGVDNLFDMIEGDLIYLLNKNVELDTLDQDMRRVFDLVADKNDFGATLEDLGERYLMTKTKIKKLSETQSN
jgi:hypothetical protein